MFDFYLKIFGLMKEKDCVAKRGSWTEFFLYIILILNVLAYYEYLIGFFIQIYV